MAIVLALEKLYDDVQARFVADGAPIPMRFGWREPGRQHNETTRIEVIPGDDASGDFGRLAAPKYPGRNPRPLWTPEELFTVYISSHDPTAPENERAQYRATRLVYDRFARALYLAAHGTVSIGQQRWIIERKQRRFGATLRLVGAILGMTPDTEHVPAPIDAKARITVSELTQEPGGAFTPALTETFDVEAPDP